MRAKVLGWKMSSKLKTKCLWVKRSVGCLTGCLWYIISEKLPLFQRYPCHMYAHLLQPTCHYFFFRSIRFSRHFVFVQVSCCCFEIASASAAATAWKGRAAASDRACDFDSACCCQCCRWYCCRHSASRFSRWRRRVGKKTDQHTKKAKNIH